MSRPLDRSRPLWEVYFDRGARGRPGRPAVEVPPDPGRRRRDRRPRPGAARRHARAQGARARRVAAAAAAVRRRRSCADAVQESLAHPSTVVATVQAHADAAVRRPAAASGGSPCVGAALDQPPARTRLAGHRPLSQQRRFVTVRTDLAAYRRMRKVHGGSVNDVILATVTGALRGWLLARSESMAGVRQLRAMVPMSVIDDELEATSLGTQIARHLVDLPIGEASPVVRLHQVSYAFQAHSETGHAVAANRLAGHRRLRAHDVPRARLAGRRRGVPQGLPPHRHQRPRPAVPAVRRRRADARDLPGPAAAARTGAGDRRDVVRRRRLLRHHRRPRRAAGRRHSSASA